MSRWYECWVCSLDSEIDEDESNRRSQRTIHDEKGRRHYSANFVTSPQKMAIVPHRSPTKANNFRTVRVFGHLTSLREDSTQRGAECSALSSVIVLQISKAQAANYGSIFSEAYPMIRQGNDCSSKPPRKLKRRRVTWAREEDLVQEYEIETRVALASMWDEGRLPTAYSCSNRDSRVARCPQRSDSGTRATFTRARNPREENANGHDRKMSAEEMDAAQARLRKQLKWTRILKMKEEISWYPPQALPLHQAVLPHARLNSVIPVHDELDTEVATVNGDLDSGVIEIDCGIKRVVGVQNGVVTSGLQSQSTPEECVPPFPALLHSDSVHGDAASAVAVELDPNLMGTVPGNVPLSECNHIMIEEISEIDLPGGEEVRSREEEDSQMAVSGSPPRTIAKQQCGGSSDESSEATSSVLKEKTYAPAPTRRIEGQIGGRDTPSNSVDAETDSKAKNAAYGLSEAEKTVEKDMHAGLMNATRKMTQKRLSKQQSNGAASHNDGNVRTDSNCTQGVPVGATSGAITGTQALKVEAVFPSSHKVESAGDRDSLYLFAEEDSTAMLRGEMDSTLPVPLAGSSDADLKVKCAAVEERRKQLAVDKIWAVEEFRASKMNVDIDHNPVFEDEKIEGSKNCQEITEPVETNIPTEAPVTGQIVTDKNDDLPEAKLSVWSTLKDVRRASHDGLPNLHNTVSTTPDAGIWRSSLLKPRSDELRTLIIESELAADTTGQMVSSMVEFSEHMEKDPVEITSVTNPKPGPPRTSALSPLEIPTPQPERVVPKGPLQRLAAFSLNSANALVRRVRCYVGLQG